MPYELASNGRVATELYEISWFRKQKSNNKNI